ncbi:N-acetyltransferase [Clostridium beijerinckii]|uniref:Acetyltransferase n=1 Tax=Clostridium beijerinckii TaxID=1520 RepID=A0AAX0B9N1_CLOBE|nr:N-acetyltransferase [Clostridium beijerinckii]MBA8933415.1 putative acetyltransferase [Clostridium beijerinckii]NRT36640.1 putative acetyltransferase [Clostridium beijerinckii]NRT43928.1 putative acetyltransferase [Clostridium beijerinckii]NRT91837.1 putative acetyltransferase [Clostridium beijerinckii]NRU37616.1 putative acetyltransferase [Clostridium beijerinckii]
MIKDFKLDNLDKVMEIWIDTNIEAHDFIPKEYWKDNFELVKQMLPSADIYIFEENNIIKGFIGIVEQNYIAGLFVKKEYQREGVGKKLIEYCKSKYSNLTLHVFTKNMTAVNFYMKNNFKVIDEHINEDTKAVEYTMAFGEK